MSPATTMNPSKTHTPTVHDVPQRVIDRIMRSVDQREPGACWPWLLSAGSHGYGQVGWSVGGGRSAMTTAHRVVWMHYNGSIPDGLTVDHQKALGCSGGICCNPAHLRLLPNVENARDNQQLAKSSCPRGHAYDEANTYTTPRGHRRCRQCAQDYEARRPARRRKEMAA